MAVLCAAVCTAFSSLWIYAWGHFPESSWFKHFSCSYSRASWHVSCFSVSSNLHIRTPIINLAAFSFFYRSLRCCGKRWGVVTLPKKIDPSMNFITITNSYFILYHMTCLYLIFWINFRLVSEALQKMKGKIPEIASSHVSSRVLQVFNYLFFLNVYLFFLNASNYPCMFSSLMC